MVVGMVAEGQRCCGLSACAVLYKAPRLLTSHLLGHVATLELQGLCKFSFIQAVWGNGALRMLGSQCRGLAAGCM